jgi:hypothetical protein
VLNAGVWKMSLLRGNDDLEMLMLDNNVVQYGKQSYNDMVKDEEEDMKQCKVAWNRKLQ